MRGPVPAKSPLGPAALARDQRRGTIPPLPAPSLLICEAEMGISRGRKRSSERSALLKAECRRVGRGARHRFPAPELSENR